MTPLHRAVIEQDAEKIKDIDFISKWRDVPDRLGFTALEIAQFLGRYSLLPMLGGELPQSFRLHPHGIKLPVPLSLKGFEKALGFRYRPFLTFSSYDLLSKVIGQCPYLLRSRFLADDNYKWTSLYLDQVLQGAVAPICIKWIDIHLGYGAFAEQDLPEGAFIGEYTGVVRRLFRRHPDQNPYCFHYPTKFWSAQYWTIDALREGNLTRFINHSDEPNLQPLCLVDRQMLHLILVAKQKIHCGEQLTFDYGKDYWARKKELLS